VQDPLSIKAALILISQIFLKNGILCHFHHQIWFTSTFFFKISSRKVKFYFFISNSFFDEVNLDSESDQLEKYKEVIKEYKRLKDKLFVLKYTTIHEYLHYLE
jgi:hypothetical protein